MVRMRPHGFLFRPRPPSPAPLLSPAEPLGPLPANFSKTRAVWEKAKKKVTGLNPRTLLQEQAFEHGGRPGPGRSASSTPAGTTTTVRPDAASLFLQRHEDPAHPRPGRRSPGRLPSPAWPPSCPVRTSSSTPWPSS
ncbi:MAG: hypothetical protein MZV64_49430 [Ignavibacteriales bacterium]|nr:hypothetical protein [Ignavibacteriales bacterium]